MGEADISAIEQEAQEIQAQLLAKKVKKVDFANDGTDNSHETSGQGTSLENPDRGAGD